MNPAKKLQHSLGIPILDSQHMELIEDMEKIEEVILQERYHVISPMLFGLQKKVIAHFAEEETLLKKIAYPDTTNHMEQHRTMLDLITSLASMTHTKETGRIITLGMTKMMTDHIKIQDMDFAAYWHNSESFTNVRFRARDSGPMPLL